MTRLLPDALFLSLTQPDLHPMGPGWDRNKEEVKFPESFLRSGLVHREIWDHPEDNMFWPQPTSFCVQQLLAWIESIFFIYEGFDNLQVGARSGREENNICCCPRRPHLYSWTPQWHFGNDINKQHGMTIAVVKTKTFCCVFFKLSDPEDQPTWLPYLSSMASQYPRS